MNRKTDGAAKGLLADDRGAVFLWTLFVALPVFFALGAVVVDAHRTYNTFDEAQSFADHTALAAAMELNGQPGAIDRAIEAACGPGPENRPLVRGFHTYGSGDHTLEAWHLRFFSALGSDDKPEDDIEVCEASCGGPTNCDPAEDDPAARFVEVTTAPVTVSWLLAPVMNAFGMNVGTSANAAARATAGQPPMANCGWAPLWMCNPLQSTGGSLGDKNYLGMQIHVKINPSDNKVKDDDKKDSDDKDKQEDKQNPPGNFNLSEAPDGHGGAKFRDAIKSYNPVNPQCMTNHSVATFQQGNMAGPVQQGFDSRFCSGDPDPMPKDECFSNPGACAFPDHPLFKERFGKGDWCGTPPCPTRFSQYLTQRTQTTCEKWTPPPGGQLDRREFILAVVDCFDSNEDHKYSGNNTKDIPVREYIRVFITEPVANPPDFDIYMENLGPANAQTLGEIFKEYPVLYR